MIETAVRFAQIEEDRKTLLHYDLFDLRIEKGSVDSAGKKCVYPLRRAAGVQ